MNRRTFLQALAAGSSLAARAATVEPDPQFPTGARSRLAVASYPFRRDLDPSKGAMKLLDFPKFVVGRYNVHGIEPLDDHFPSVEDAYLAQFREALSAANAHIVNIPVGRLQGSFYDPDEQKRSTAITNARRWIDVAAALGSPSVRLHMQSVRGVAPNVDRAAESLAQVAGYGFKKTVIVNLENDDPASEEAFFLIDVMDRVGSGWLRALPDFCNSMLLDRGEDYNYKAVTAMFRRACNISHAKEIETEKGKTYKVDVARTFAIAKRAGYRGYFSMEWDSSGDPYTGTQHLIDTALQALT
jgi:sugar phosphate isomerase/epimerase